MYVVSAAAVYSSLSRNSVYCLCRVGLLSVNALHYLPKEITILPLEYYSLLDSGISATVARWLISPDCVQSHHGVVYCLCITSSAHSIFQQKNQSLDLEPNLFDFLIKKNSSRRHCFIIFVALQLCNQLLVRFSSLVCHVLPVHLPDVL